MRQAMQSYFIILFMVCRTGKWKESTEVYFNAKKNSIRAKAKKKSVFTLISHIKSTHTQNFFLSFPFKAHKPSTFCGRRNERQRL